MIIDSQIARLRQIETMLAKTPALVPIAQRLNGIGRALEDQIDIVRDKRCDLTDRISRIKKPETALAPGEIKTARAEGAKSLEAQTAAESQKAGASRPDSAPDRIGRTNLALPASCVLRVAQSSEKKGLEDFWRGAMQLLPISSLISRGIKSGVLGEWTKLPGKKLKVLQVRAGGAGFI